MKWRRARRREGRTAGVFQRAGNINALEGSGTLTGGFDGLTNVVTTGPTTDALDIGAATNTPAFYQCAWRRGSYGSVITTVGLNVQVCTSKPTVLLLRLPLTTAVAVI